MGLRKRSWAGTISIGMGGTRIKNGPTIDGVRSIEPTPDHDMGKIDATTAALKVSYSPQKPSGWEQTYGQAKGTGGPFGVGAGMEAKGTNRGVSITAAQGGKVKKQGALGKRFDDLKQRLGSAWFWKKDNMVREFVGSLSNDELQKLTPQQINDLVEELLESTNLTEKDLASVHRLYSIETFDPTMTQSEHMRKRDLVCRFVNSLSGYDHRKLTLQQENNLVSKLLSGMYTATTAHSAIHHLYAIATFDPGATQFEHTRNMKLANTLADDPIIQEAKAAWKALGTPSRLTLMQHVANVVAVAFQLQKGDLETFSEGSKNDIVKFGFARDGLIHINTHEDAFEHFFECIGTVIHEYYHLYDSALVAKIANGHISLGDPQYQQGRAFQLNSEYYVEGSIDYHAYSNQPAEACARKTTRVIIAALKSRLR